MSLLMDALKKAEQAKAKTDEEHTSSSIESCQSEKNNAIEDEPAGDAQHQGESTESLMLKEIKPVPEQEAEVEELDFSIDNVETLEDVKSETAEPEKVVVDGQKDVNAADTERLEQDPAEVIAPSKSQESVKASETVPAKETPPVSESLPVAEEKHESQSSVSEPKPEIKEVSSQVNGESSVKAVPTLIGKRKFHPSFIWIALIISLMFSGLGYYYFTLMSSTQKQELVFAENIDQPFQREDEVKISSSESDSVLEKSSLNSSAAETPKIIAGNMVEKQLAVQSESRAKKPVPPTKKALVSETQKQVQVKQLQITRNEKTSSIDMLLASAYLHYQADELNEAGEDYRRALKIDRNNRDALLGLAVIYQRQGYLVEAERLYRSVLALDPKDSVANAGLMSLPVDGNNLQNETQLKLMLNEEPTAAHLHFSLGNEYAARANWPEAQQAYFNAYRYASENGDYAYNLAISLERLGQSQAALPYYRHAQEIAVDSVVGFDSQKVAQRIEALTKAKNGQ